jgi:HD-like signal output (HDOD) protein
MRICKACKRVYVNERDYLKGTSGWRVASDGNLYFNCSCEETIILEKGTFDWFSPKKVLSDAACTVFDSWEDGIGKIPRVSAASARVISLLSKETATTLEIAQALKRDPLLSSGILRAANGAGGFESKTSFKNLEQAINFLGRKSLSKLATSASVANFRFNTRIFNAKEYWLSAYLTGYISEYVARKFALHLPNDLCYLAGSFLNIGKCIGAIMVPQEMDRAFESTRTKLKPWSWAEAEFRLTSIELLAEVACCIWGLPTECREVATQQISGVAEAARASRPNILVVCAFACQMSHLLRNSPYLVEEDILEACEQSLRINVRSSRAKLLDELSPALDRALADCEELTSAA